MTQANHLVITVLFRTLRSLLLVLKMILSLSISGLVLSPIPSCSSSSKNDPSKSKTVNQWIFSTTSMKAWIF